MASRTTATPLSLSGAVVAAVGAVVADFAIADDRSSSRPQVVVAVALAARVVDVLTGVVCRPARLLVPAPPAPARTVRPAIDSLREGSMLRWCGWIIRSARRGPPPAPHFVLLPSCRARPS